MAWHHGVAISARCRAGGKSHAQPACARPPRCIRRRVVKASLVQASERRQLLRGIKAYRREDPALNVPSAGSSMRSRALAFRIRPKAWRPVAPTVAFAKRWHRRPWPAVSAPSRPHRPVPWRTGTCKRRSGHRQHPRRRPGAGRRCPRWLSVDVVVGHRCAGRQVPGRKGTRCRWPGGGRRPCGVGPFRVGANPSVRQWQRAHRAHLGQPRADALRHPACCATEAATAAGRWLRCRQRERHVGRSGGPRRWSSSRWCVRPAILE